MAQDVSVDTTMKFILRDEKHLALALEVEEAMPNVWERLIKEVTEGAKERLKEWGKNEDWKSSPSTRKILYCGERVGQNNTIHGR